jgi:hypothetical protein
VKLYEPYVSVNTDDEDIKHSVALSAAPVFVPYAPSCSGQRWQYVAVAPGRKYPGAAVSELLSSTVELYADVLDAFLFTVPDEHPAGV